MPLTAALRFLPHPARCALVTAVMVLCSTPGHAQNVQCHLGYAGAQRTLTVPPSRLTEDTYPQVEGASFAFKVVNRLPPEPGAGVQVSTYATGLNLPFLLHQATYSATETTGPHGFTGLQVVNEPVRGHEIAYWCERAPR